MVETFYPYIFTLDTRWSELTLESIVMVSLSDQHAENVFIVAISNCRFIASSSLGKTQSIPITSKMSKTNDHLFSISLNPELGLMLLRVTRFVSLVNHRVLQDPDALGIQKTS